MDEGGTFHSSCETEGATINEIDMLAAVVEVDSDDGFYTDDEELEEVREVVRRIEMQETVAMNSHLNSDQHNSNDADQDITELDEEYWNDENPPSPPQYNSEDELIAEREGTKVSIDPKFPIFNNKAKADEVQIEFGMQFQSNVEFKNAIDDYAIVNGYNLVYDKNDVRICRLTCHGSSVDNKPCEWCISATWMNKKKTFQVISLGPKHVCKRTIHKNKRLSAEWLSKYYEERVRLAPSWLAKEMKQTVWAELRLNVSEKTCCKALLACKLRIEGDFKDHFKRLWDYAAEIKRANEDNSVYLRLKEGTNVFHSIYVCFSGLKKGWKAGCRPVIGVDGCFLKGVLEGQILSAVGVDGNNQMYPIAWSVVPRETQETWTWFLQYLIADLVLNNGEGLIVISDKQKGLINAIANLLPEAEHRFCARHVYANFRKKFGGLQYRTHFWSIVNASTQNMYEDRLNELRKFDPSAAADLECKDPTQWCKAWFSLSSCCDSVTNNITEVWNGTIIEARRMSILGLLEKLREAPIRRMNARRKLFNGKDGDVCPRILTLLATREVEAAKWSCLYTGAGGYEVQRGTNALCNKYVVSLQDGTCSCRSWQLTGIPCVHAICAIWQVRDEPKNFVSDWYKKDAYLKTYFQWIEMLNGPNEWPRQGKPEIECPPLKVWKGRPRSKRIREVGESAATKSKISRKGQRQVCRDCGVVGHNKKTCKSRRSAQVGSNSSQSSIQVTTSQPYCDWNTQESQNL